MSENHIDYAPSPELGSGNMEVYHTILGLTEAEITELRKNKII